MKEEDLRSKYEIYGWNPSQSLSPDENCMDLVLLITRSARFRQGSMACILIQPQIQDFFASILVAATNASFYKQSNSDLHAEIAALTELARNGGGSDGATAYITMPPCKRCLPALHRAGIKRIVTRYPFQNKALMKSLLDHGITFKNMGKQYTQDQISRARELIEKRKEKDGPLIKKQKVEEDEEMKKS